MAYVSFAIVGAAVLIYSSTIIAEETGCGVNEAKFPCGQRCELRCNAPLPPYCKGLNCEAPFSCRCKNGFARDPETNQCVAIHECPVNECGVGQIKAFCGRQCEGTCFKPYEPEACKIIRCAMKECRCDLNGGFVRNGTGRCVRQAECVELK